MTRLSDGFKRFTQDYLLKKGYLIHRATQKKELVELIGNLYPMQTEFELIRLGANGDGGYLVPDDLEGIEACFSPGVDKIWEFERACLNRGMKVFMADKSVDKSLINNLEREFSFIKKFVGCTNSEDFITMDEWIKTSDTADSSDLLLQMDIEGGEYYSFINMTDSAISRFRIMVIEFHLLQDLWNNHFFELVKTVFNKILRTHVCVHIHPNNCCAIHKRNGIEIPKYAEFTFLRKDRIRMMNYAVSFPHSLDCDNTDNKTVVLPKDWYKGTC